MVDHFTEFQKGQINQKQFSHKVTFGSLYFVYLAMILFTTTYIYMAAWVYTGERLTRQIRERYLRAILRQNIAYFDKIGAGEIDRSAKRRVDFGFETTLSGQSYLKLIQGLKNVGYQVHFFFLWLPKEEMALSRIKDRVEEGVHDVPEADARRRFPRSICNFLNCYRSLATSWFLFENSGSIPSAVAFHRADKLSIIRPEIYEPLLVRYRRT